MSWKIIKTETEYQTAVARMVELFDVEPNTSESEELELLMVLIKDYDDKFVVLPELDTISAIKVRMQEMGVKAKDLEPIIGSKGHVSSILSGKREITLKMAQKLKIFFDLPAEAFLHSA
jgi:HTH-type transcriptional regulator / antitoxin HigA